MRTPTQRLPGPELPLVAYDFDGPFHLNEIAWDNYSSSIYRAIVRCYAIEMRPTRVIPPLTGLKRMGTRIAVGASFDCLDDPQGGLYVKGRELAYDLGVSHQPVLGLCGLWNVSRILSPDAESVYRHAVINVIMRLQIMGLPTAHDKFAAKWGGGCSSPDLERRFTTARPGAIVAPTHGVMGESWVTRQHTQDVVEIENAGYQTDIVHVSSLEVLG